MVREGALPLPVPPHDKRMDRQVGSDTGWITDPRKPAGGAHAAGAVPRRSPRERLTSNPYFEESGGKQVKVKAV